MIEEKIEQAKQFIEEADAVLITAGAGMGVDIYIVLRIHMPDLECYWLWLKKKIIIILYIHQM
jgi:hypothetical protein